MIRKILKWTLVALAVAFIGIQFVRPAKTNPAVDESRTLNSHAQVSPDIAAIMERSCNDCHTNKTRWPWYSEIAPVSWYLVHDVNEGRKHLNLSDWAKYDARRANRKLDEICEQVEKGEMPPKAYLILHPSAKLSDADKKALCDWAKSEQERVNQSPATNAQ